MTRVVMRDACCVMRGAWGVMRSDGKNAVTWLSERSITTVYCAAVRVKRRIVIRYFWFSEC